MRARLGRTLDRIDARMDSLEAAVHRSDTERAEMREFMREMNIRYERSFELVAGELKEMGDQIRANTAATWAMVDEIRGTSR